MKNSTKCLTGKTKEATKSNTSNSTRKTTPWGVSSHKSTHLKFKAYLAKLTSAEEFIQKGNAGLVFLKGLPQRKRDAIYARLKEVDSAGYEKLVRRMKTRGKRMQVQRDRVKKGKGLMPPTKSEIAETFVGVETAIAETPAASVIRFVSQDGIKHVAAVCLAAGYKREETAQMLGLTLGELSLMVTNEDVVAAVGNVNKAVVAVADQKVLRDLLAGSITDDTNRADLIATRRKKLALDASAEARNLVKDSEELQRKRENYLNKRFGYDTKQGGAESENNNG